MQAKDIRQKFLKFFEESGHKILPSASLVPENDPTALFTTAGMQPLVPYLLGERHALGNRLANSQKCLRTADIDEVGDNTHLTFFEMLGNWSLGDYFKKEAIEMSFEFLTKELSISLDKIAVSVFAGDNDAPCDEESAQIWQEFGISKARIAYLPKSENWWGPAGQTGPCGPDTEIFYWTGLESAPEKFDPADARWVEIWNNVFMEYNKTAEGKFEPLKQKNVDTGMGLERIATALQNKTSVFETELFSPLIEKVAGISSKHYQDKKKEFRIIVDHIKAAVFILAEQIEPSNIERGYVLRRLIRRAVRYGKVLGITDLFTSQIAKKVIEVYNETYPELENNRDCITDTLDKEESSFLKTLERGLKEFEKMTGKAISGEKAFLLYQSFGFPIELIKEIAKEKDIKVDEQGFCQELKKHQELSRTASKGKFKAGLADQSETTVKYHTATHLLLYALRNVLGKQVEQKGSNITPERIRFDFSYERKLTKEEIQQVEDLVNKAIERNLEIKVEEMTVEQAQEQGALVCFREKYPDRVKVYTVFNKETGEVFSKEICSGPHCQNTKELAELGKFRIVKEQSSSNGVRRLRAVLQ